MKAMEYIYFLFLFNAFLFIFTNLGIYNLAINAPDTWVDVSQGINAISVVLSIAGIGTLTAIGVGLVARFTLGTTGLQTMAISVLTGFFVGLFYNTYSTLNTMSQYLGEFSNVLHILLILTGTIFVITLINAVRQMGTGGDRAYE